MPPSSPYTLRGRSRRLDPNKTTLSSHTTLRSSIPNSSSISAGSESDLDSSSLDTLPIRKQHTSGANSPKTALFLINNDLDLHSISIYRNPITVLYYFGCFVVRSSRLLVNSLLSTYLYWVVGVVTIISAAGISYCFEGVHQPYLLSIESFIQWYGTWIVLGILSSVGLGSGLHTFLIFLGPHIAKITNAAYSCGHVDFVSRTWDQIHCHQLTQSELITAIPINIMMVAHKIQWDAFCWGLGTAIGELPPYFVARAAARSGKRNAELNDLNLLMKKPASNMSYAEWAKVQIMLAMRKFGFWGILACASIPNPLFDLAGIISGTVGIRFRTFFSATLIGKAIVKTSIQSLFIAVLFSKGGQTALLDLLNIWAPALHDPIAIFLEEQTDKYQGSSISDTANNKSKKSGMTSGRIGKLLGYVWNSVITLIIAYFILSTIESLAKQEIEQLAAGMKKKQRVVSPSTLKRVKSRSGSRSRTTSLTTTSSAYPANLIQGSPSKGSYVEVVLTSNNESIPKLKSRPQQQTPKQEVTESMSVRRTSSRLRSKHPVVEIVQHSSPLFEPGPVRESDADAEMSSPAEVRRRPLSRRHTKRET